MLRAPGVSGAIDRIADSVSRWTDTSRIHGSILLIDDNPGVVGALEVILRSAGHEVHSTTHGGDTFRLIDLLKPRLVITDVIMEEIDTLDVIGDLRRRHPDIKIVAISGNPHLLTLAAKRGADHILAKPFGAHRLNTLVKAALQ